MIANYHTHTPRCKHAEGAEESYIQAALDAQMEILGFSDHAPQFYPDGRISRIRMLPEELPEYVSTLQALRSQYGQRLQMHIGLETEYYPALFPQLLSYARDNGIEYLILGQHWCGNEIGEPYNGWETAEEDLLARYCHQVADAMQTGLFTYIAHPDILNFVGDADVYAKHIRFLCKEAKNNQIPLEINLLGMANDKNYPNPSFWRIAGEEGCLTVLGADAHKPEGLLVPELEDRARALVKACDLQLLDKVQLQRIY